MTKYKMVKRLCDETGMKKKDAYVYLRNSDWDYSKAIALWRAIQAIEKIDWRGICDEITKGFNKIVECMSESLQRMADNLHTLKQKEEQNESQKRTEKPADAGGQKGWDDPDGDLQKIWSLPEQGVNHSGKPEKME